MALYKRDDSRYWWGRFSYKGKPFRRSLDTTSKPVAEQRLAKWKEDVKALGWGEKPPRSFDDMMLSFVENHLPALKPNAAKRYRVSIRQLFPHFTGMPLDKIGSASLSGYEASRRKQGTSSPTIIRDMACLSSAFTHAIMDLEWLDTNPVPTFLTRQKRRGRLRDSQPKTRWLTHAEEDALLAEAHPDLANEIRIAIDTGMRDTELRTLRWGQVDLEAGHITIDQATAKNHRERQIPLLARSATLLRARPRHLHSDYVFYRPDGGIYTTRKTGFRAAVRRSGVKYLSWHDLRRTCGCRLLQDHGLSLIQVRDWLGHLTIQQTERAYAFLTVENLKEAINK